MRVNIKKIDSSHLALLASLVFGLRWMLVANGFDYGWDFETGYRVYYGGIYGRDFYTALGPLSYQLIGWLFKLFGPRWVWVYPLYYFCWAMTLAGVLIIFRNLTERKEILSLTLLAIVPLSIPHISALHLYNFLGSALQGVFFFSKAKTNDAVIGNGAVEN